MFHRNIMSKLRSHLLGFTVLVLALTSISNLGVLGAFFLTLIALLILQTKNKSSIN